jgi:XTP/dITP diphosphohydrolase
MDKVHQAMAQAGGGGGARFVCALALAWPGGRCDIFEGTVEGDIVWPPRGEKGFGYDPIFRPTGHAVTFAEMDPEAKHAISHRAAAFAKLVAACSATESEGR